MMKALDNESCSWYKVFTAAYAEKKVKKQLDEMGVANFLPLKASRLLWRNKACEREVPVTSRCIYVRLSPADLEKLSSITSLLLPADLSNCRLTDQQLEDYIRMGTSPCGKHQAPDFFSPDKGTKEE